MTVAEAIKKLEIARFAFKPESEAFASINMAIRSLEAWDKVRTEIEENRDDWIKGLDPEWHTYDRCIAIINKHLKGVTE